MKKVAIQGALNVDNFGDVLLGRIYSDFIAKQGCSVYTPKAKDSVLAEMPNAEKGAFSETDALVYIGGGYFGEGKRRFLGRYKWGFIMIKYHLSSSLHYFFTGKPIAVFGVGIGPVTNIVAWLGVLAIFYKAKNIVVRDPVGANYLKSHGYKKDFMIAPDVAITIDKSLEDYKESGEKEHLSKISGGKNVIAIHYDKQSAQDDEWHQT